MKNMLIVLEKALDFFFGVQKQEHFFRFTVFNTYRNIKKEQVQKKSFDGFDWMNGLFSAITLQQAYECKAFASSLFRDRAVSSARETMISSSRERLMRTLMTSCITHPSGTAQLKSHYARTLPHSCCVPFALTFCFTKLLEIHVRPSEKVCGEGEHEQ